MKQWNRKQNIKGLDLFDFHEQSSFRENEKVKFFDAVSN